MISFRDYDKINEYREACGMLIWGKVFVIIAASLCSSDTVFERV
jgi:hypothetical protein